MEQAEERAIAENEESEGNKCPECKTGLKLEPATEAGCGDTGWIIICPNCFYVKK